MEQGFALGHGSCGVGCRESGVGYGGEERGCPEEDTGNGTEKSVLK